MERQTAEMAHMAQVAINSERAWIVAEMIPTATYFKGYGWHRNLPEGKHTKMSEEELIRGAYLIQTVRFTNMGKTPAVITHWSVTRIDGRDPLGEVVDFDQPYHSLAAGAVMDVRDRFVDVFECAGDRDFVFFDLTVTYRHVFDSEPVTEDPTVYTFVSGAKKIERMGGIPKRKEKKRSENPN